MYKIKIVLGILVFTSNACMGQNPYTALKDVAPIYKSVNDLNCCGGVICDDCSERMPELPPSKHDTMVLNWWNKAVILKLKGLKYDSINNCYNTCDSVLYLLRSEYYSAFIDYGRNNNVFGGPNQNKSSPEYVFSAGDSAVGTIRYRVVCRDCPYPKKNKLYYIFYYDKYKRMVRHGLAYLKKGEISKH
jgi:hypothetical protein